MSCDEACGENISWLAQHFGTLKRFLSSKGSFENMAKRGDSPPPFGIHFRTDGSVSASAGFDANDISPYTLQIMQAMGSFGIFARCSESPDVFVGGSDQKNVGGHKIRKGRRKLMHRALPPLWRKGLRKSPTQEVDERSQRRRRRRRATRRNRWS